MTGPEKPFDPFGTSTSMASSDSKNQVSGFGTSNRQSAKQKTVFSEKITSPSAAMLTSPSVSGGAATDASVAVAAASNTNASVPGAPNSQQPAGHTSIFELGSEPFNDGSFTAATAPPVSSQRLGRTAGVANGNAPVPPATTSPISLHPLGAIMGSPHSLFNDAAYASSAQSQLPSSGTRSSRLPHRLSQSRFNNVLGDVGLGSSGIARGNDVDIGSVGGSGNGNGNALVGSSTQGLLDTSTSILDNIKSQQASPNASAQASGFNDFYVKSLPVSRRNSREFQNLWQELEGFSINDSTALHQANLAGGLPSHLSAIDGHAIAARNSSGAFRGDNPANQTAFGTSPKLPQGLLDDDVLSSHINKTNDGFGADGKAAKGVPPAASVSGMVNGFSRAAVNADSQQQQQQNAVGGYPGFTHDSRLPNAGRLQAASAALNPMNNQQQQQPVNSSNVDTLHTGPAAHDLRHYEPARGVNLIRNASTPVLNTKQYQVMQNMDDLSHGHIPMRAAAPMNAGIAELGSSDSRFDGAAALYSSQFHGGYPVAMSSELVGDVAGGARVQHGSSNYPYPVNPSNMVVHRNGSFVAGGTMSGSSTPNINGYGGVQGPFGPAIHGFYGAGQQTTQSSVPHTPLQQPQYAPLHVQGLAANQVQIHAQQQQHSRNQAQRHSQQPPQQQQQQQQQQMATSSAQNSSGAAATGPPGSGSHSHGPNHHQKNPQGKAHRKTDAESNRFANTSLEELKGTMFDVCKDQHGCRFLQRKLEERQEGQIALIFSEVLPHFSALMTDPFGNYLCQKMLEYCTEEQRTQIVVSVAPDLVNISLNMHGTRAVQKMIESLSCQEQIDAIIDALKDSVVMLIRDLNGNHVIQKCLGRLSSKNNQFIYDSVAKSCTDVATHRHGCCVFQRCIDYSSVEQKGQLVEVIITQALALVQDPFGNYVVQYVLDLGVPDYSEPVIRMFVNHICGLSVQKFSSNVMEKCIRIASPATRKMLIVPLMQRERLDMLMRDSYGNYVVQTALDFADNQVRAELIEAIVPLLPLIRHTPYGKRIFIKLQRDGFVSAVPSAAGSRHASPILGPSHSAHSTTALSSMNMYPQMMAPGLTLPPTNGSAPSAGAVSGASGSSSVGAALSRGVSPLAGGAASGVSAKNRSFASTPATRITGAPMNMNGGAFQQQQQQQQQQQAPGNMYYYNMAGGADGAGVTQMYHAGMPAAMAPAHANGMTPASSSTPVATTAAASSGTGSGAHTPLYYGGGTR
ncbi:hypothetical protein IW140_000962 [Coemansia sp. RSA 1813]|nr:hypothetical protein IW138_001814 [Coemansia sp. RSA 986]KAJ2212373.1 hypothetical protein EV179_004698 [Coemansia sp. RSA 487]KAJ2572213.1 hypothetical protein IW140_000962 [Coemansia sp. RSA 1813]